MKGLSEAQYLEEIKQRDLRIAALEIENKLLREKVDLLIKKVFGSSSEKLDDSQLSLFGLNQENVPGKSDASLSNNEEAASQSRRHVAQPKVKGIPEHLPVQEEVIDPAEVKTEPTHWRCIGAEVSEQLDYEPARFFRRRLIRRKYVSTQDKEASPIIAPLPEKLLERGQIAPGLLAHVIVSKYCDHLPLYRQEAIYWQRHGVWLSRQRLAVWMGVVADWVRLIYQCIHTGVMSGGYVQIDETPIRYLDPGNGKTKLGYLWTASRPGGDVVYRWEISRGTQCLKNLVPVDFTGTIQSDGYVAYGCFAEGKPELTMAGCWTHARRHFFEAKEFAPKLAGWFLIQIGHLYRIERELRASKAGPKIRAVVRAQQARPIYQRLFRVLEKLNLVGHYLPKSKIAQAIAYALSLQTQLGVYLEDGRIEIDNNLVENAIRPTALGKKNWLFIGEAEAGERSAILYTLVECCRRRGIDPEAYFKDILTRLPNMTNQQIAQLTPENWAKAHGIQPLQRAA